MMEIRKSAPLALPKHILDVFMMFDEAELPAWLVGGCLRDIFLERTPSDWDFATPCPPELVRKKLVAAGLTVWDTGLKHGTVTFRYQGISYEITTFRVDGPYLDHRRPEWVAFTTSLQDDLARRDFTVNAMAYSPRDGLADPFGGLRDMQDNVIRAVGLPQDRLEEDALRILRGIRFAGSLDFFIEESLFQTMKEKAGLLQWISPERLAAELKAILLLPSPHRALRLLAKMGIWPYVIPELVDSIGFEQHSSHHYLDVYDHLIQTVENTPPDLSLRLAALLHDIAKPVVFTLDEKGKGHFYNHEVVGAEMAGKILDRLRFSHAIRDQVILLILHHMLHLKVLKDVTIRRMISGLPKPRKENLEQILLLQKADLLASRYTEKSLIEFEGFARRCRQVLASGCPLDLGDLAVRGEELAGLGVAPAKRGKALKALLAEVLREPGYNQRDILLKIVERYAGGKEANE